MTHNLTDTSDGAPSFAQLLQFAREAGLAERTIAAQSGRACFINLESADSAAVCALRKEAVLGEVPLIIARAIAISMSWEKQLGVPVMELNHSEYPGPLWRTRSNPTPSELDPKQLRLAGREVFDYLDKAGMAPHLGYVYDGTTRSYSLQIIITLRIH